jgi:hypothetical protein
MRAQTGLAAAWLAAMALVVAGLTGLMSTRSVHASEELDASWAANVTNGRIANALAATGDSETNWNPPRPGEPCLVQVDVSGGASLTWCLQVKAVDSDSVPWATLATGTGDQNFVTTAWPVMNITVSTYASGTVSAWGAQGTR